MRDDETYAKTIDRDASLPVDCPQPFRLLLTALKESGDTLGVMETFFSDLWSTRTTW